MKRNLKTELCRVLNEIVEDGNYYQTIHLEELTQRVKKYAPKGVDKKMVEIIEEGEYNIERNILKSNTISFKIRDHRKKITKTTAISLLGISKGKFEKLNIPILAEVDNPYYKCASPMIIYLESDVLQYKAIIK